MSEDEKISIEWLEKITEINKKDLELEEQDTEYEYDVFEFMEYGYYLLNEVFQAMGIDSELV